MTGVEERSVAQVLDEMFAFHERCHTNPLRAFGTHGSHPAQFADPLGLHQHGHGMAADTCPHQRTIRDLGTPIVRTARAEER